MKAFSKLTAILTAAVLTVPNTAVRAETQADTDTVQTEQERTVFDGYCDKLLELVTPKCTHAEGYTAANTEIGDYIVLTVRIKEDTQKEEIVSIVRRFMTENDLKSAWEDELVKTALYPDETILTFKLTAVVSPAVTKAAEMINAFIAENGLNAEAKIYPNRIDSVILVIENLWEEKDIVRAVSEFMKENGTDEALIDHIVWEPVDENGVRRGDIDKNGFMTGTDLKMLKDCIKTYPDDILPDVCDFNCDGRADINDVTALEEYLDKMESIFPGSTSNPELMWTHSCFSEISVSGSDAVCKSLTCGYGSVTKIITEQILQKKDENGKWKNIKTWKKAFSDHKAAVNNKAPKLSKGYYRLMTISYVYSGNSNEIVKKSSRRYIIGAKADTGDANGDGKVNVRDCAYIAKMIAKGDRNKLPAKADYNLDGKRNVRDAAALASDLAEGI